VTGYPLILFIFLVTMVLDTEHSTKIYDTTAW